MKSRGLSPLFLLLCFSNFGKLILNVEGKIADVPLTVNR